MPLEKRDVSVLQHIVEHGYEVEKTLARFGARREIFNRDFLYRNAVSMPVFAITELTKHLSEEFKASYAEIPWTSISAMRNRFAHDYSSIDWDILWQTACEDIPVVCAFCQTVLRENGQDVPSPGSIDQMIE